MTNNTTPAKKPIHKKWWFWLIAVIVFFGIIDAIVPDTTNNSKQEQQTASDTEVQQPTAVKDEPVETQEETYEIDGFTLYNSQKYDDGSATASYNPDAYDNYSLTVNIGGELLGHEDFYTLERQTQTINGISVSTGYTDDDFHDGLQLETAYRSLAFDFTLEGVNYSGEISNLLGEGAKDETMNVLQHFIMNLTAK